MFRFDSVVISLRSLGLLMLMLAMLAVPGLAQRIDTDGLASTQTAFRQIHDKVAPAVVFINSRFQETSSANPLDLFFGQGSTTPRTVNASGSGVIIRPEGIILTNSHVVANATKVTVTLAGSTDSLPAEVVQTDPRTDLAIVRITQKGTYPTATLGDASKVQPGDWAIAFGAPFRLPTTMTVGVISATGRILPNPNDVNNYRDVLQTDAAINPGNSGGPLVNINGEVIGIDFMIFSPGDQGGSVGIGFAVPINGYNRHFIDTMVAGQSPVRGQLGIGIKNLDAAMREQYGVKEGGVFVDQVTAGKAAELAGIKDEDVIISYNGMKVTDQDQFVTLVELTPPGTKVPIVIMRNKKEMTITATVGSSTAKLASTTTGLNENSLGMSVTTLTSALADRLNLPLTTNGVVVTQVEQGSPADDLGLQQGDIITRVAGVMMTSEEQFWTELSKAMVGSKNGVLLRVRRGNTATTLTLPQMDVKK